MWKTYSSYEQMAIFPFSSHLLFHLHFDYTVILKRTGSYCIVMLQSLFIVLLLYNIFSRRIYLILIGRLKNML